MKTVAVLGAGAWGTAISILLAARHRVLWWCREPDRAREIAQRRENARYLPDVKIPDSIDVTSRPPPPASADVVVVAIPTQHIRETLRLLTLDRGARVLSLAKGIEIGTLRRPSEILGEFFDRVSVLSGPSMAREVATGMPTSVVCAGPDAAEIQELFMGPTFRVYTSRDLVGVELAGALKNVIAIAAGACDGLKLGDNAKAAVLTRGVVEMGRFGVAMGADSQTFFGLAGIGDLITSCYSPLGRNLSVGRQVGAGKSLEQILREMVHVPEGVWTVKAVVELARRRGGIDMPISTQIYQVLYEGKPPRAALRDLMTRAPKAEDPPPGCGMP